MDGATGNNGTYALPVLLGGSTTLRVISDGSWQRVEGDSNPISVGINRVIGWTIPSTVRRGESFTISGQVQPQSAGIAVSLNNPSNPSGVSAPAQSATTDANGNFTFTTAQSQPGFYTFNISTPADSTFAATQTSFVTVVVR